MESERISLNVLSGDLTFLDKIHPNRSEAIRIIIRKLRKQNTREEMMKTTSLIGFGVLILGISMLMNPTTLFWIIFLFMGMGFSFVGIVNLVLISNNSRRKKVDLET